MFLLRRPRYSLLDATDWDTMKKIVDLLKPLTVATESVHHCCYSPISVVFPLYKVIIQRLTEEIDVIRSVTLFAKALFGECLAGRRSAPQPKRVGRACYPRSKRQLQKLSPWCQPSFEWERKCQYGESVHIVLDPWRNAHLVPRLYWSRCKSKGKR